VSVGAILCLRCVVQAVRETLPIGSIVQGRYQIEEVLGRGGFSAVYLVRDQRVQHNLYALKEIIEPTQQERNRFVFEATLLSRVDHPALPRVYRVFEDRAHNRSYFLMDYIEGPNLDKLRKLQPNKQFSVQQMLAIMRPIIEAVAYLHEQHPPIIHRDIKPSNIIVPTSGAETVLVDFGIAKEFDPESTTTAVRHASPGYGAPEQYSMGTNTRTDIYGLGATMYVLLTGVIPADAYQRMTQLGNRGIDPLEPIQRYAPDVPQHISSAISRAIAVDSEDRFPTVQDFWNALNSPAVTQSSLPPVEPFAGAAMAGPTVRVMPLPAANPAAASTPPRQPRRPALSRKAGALLVLLLALLTGGAILALLLPGAPGNHTNPAATNSTHVNGHHATATATQRPAVTPTPASTPATAPSPASTPVAEPPILSSQYSGTIHNIPADENATMNLISIKQNGSSIQGTFQVTSPLSGSGPFTGTINSTGFIQFTVHTTQVPAPLYFQGRLHSNGSLSGTYCSLNQAGQCDTAAGGYGTWQTPPSSSGSSLSLDLLMLLTLV
jgi:serine/threonine protein kinase